MKPENFPEQKDKKSPGFIPEPKVTSLQIQKIHQVSSPVNGGKKRERETYYKANYYEIVSYQKY